MLYKNNNVTLIYNIMENFVANKYLKYNEKYKFSIKIFEFL